MLFGVTRKVGADLTRVRLNTLNINSKNTLQNEGAELADAYIEEHSVNELGFLPGK